MTVAELAAIVFAVIVAVVFVFQIALALGAPWGEYAMGGTSPGKFPSAMRVGAVVQAAFLVVLAVLVIARSGLALAGTAWATDWLVWIAVFVSAVSLVLNTITKSAKERRLWAPVAFVMLASSLTVALAG